MKNSRERKEAIELLRHPRGHYLISQAMFLAVQSMLKRPEEEQEMSNMADMLLLGLEIFPLYFLMADPGNKGINVEALT